MLSITDFRDAVIRPVLSTLDLFSQEAEALLLGTALAESGLRALRQRGGPARGLFQMEPATHDDIHDNFLDFRPSLKNRVMGFAASRPALSDQLVFNLAYAAAMCRIHYVRVPAAIPPVFAPAAMARYWKQHYNTPSGRGEADRFQDLYGRYVLPLYQERV